MMFELLTQTTPQEIPLQPLIPIGHTSGNGEQQQVISR